MYKSAKNLAKNTITTSTPLNMNAHKSEPWQANYTSINERKGKKKNMKSLVRTDKIQVQKLRDKNKTSKLH